ncbi:MAG: hypothetical protein ACI9MR_004939 [Myxococcota bacterium]
MQKARVNEQYPVREGRQATVASKDSVIPSSASAVRLYIDVEERQWLVTMLRAIAAAFIVTFGAVITTGICAAQPAPAAATPIASPIVDDTDRATRLSPVLDGFDAPVIVKAPEEPLPEEPSAERDTSILSVHSRWVSVPDFLLDVIFSDHPSYNSVSLGLGAEFGSIDSGVWVIELDWTPLVPGAGNWLTDGDDPITANYVQSSLNMISIDITHRWYVAFTPSFHFVVGSGLGIGILTGDIASTEVLPTCEAPVADCAHWRGATRENIDLPTRILPILHLTSGLQYEINEDLSARLEAGFRNVFYVGLSVGMNL